MAVMLFGKPDGIKANSLFLENGFEGMGSLVLKYPDMLCDYIDVEDTGKIRGFVLSYLHEAAFGDTLDVRVHKQDGSAYFRTVNGEGQTCLEAQILFGD